MSIILGPVIPPAGASIEVEFHFGGEDGHCCDSAQFDWYLNDIFVAFLDFNNASPPHNCETIYQGPFNIVLEDYNTDPCGFLKFSFVCKSNGGTYCHEGAKIDITQPDGTIKTRYLSTSTPTVLWICELLTGYSSPP
ncbi:MAG: hypothetical protein PHW60_01125 [Kiritimatiellae bacterium]|nr:hypothetical protein [Kiritimatiellia bacterium]